MTKVAKEPHMAARIERYKAVLATCTGQNRLTDVATTKEDDPPRYVLVSLYDGTGETWLDHFDDLPDDVDLDVEEHHYFPDYLIDLDTGEVYHPRTTTVFETSKVFPEEVKVKVAKKAKRR